jgi:arsenate reductase
MKDKNLSYQVRQIDEDNPSKEELKEWYEKSGLDIKRFFNTSGKIYREKNLKDKLKEMSLDEKFDILASDGMVVKRPILIDDDKFFIGPDVKKYIESL